MVLLVPRGHLDSAKTGEFHHRQFFDLTEIILRNAKAKALPKTGLPESPGETGHRPTLCSGKTPGESRDQYIQRTIPMGGTQCSAAGSPAQVALKGNCFPFYQQVSRLDHLGDSNVLACSQAIPPSAEKDVLSGQHNCHK